MVEGTSKELVFMEYCSNHQRNNGCKSKIKLFSEEKLIRCEGQIPIENGNLRSRCKKLICRECINFEKKDSLKDTILCGECVAISKKMADDWYKYMKEWKSKQYEMDNITDKLRKQYNLEIVLSRFGDEFQLSQFKKKDSRLQKNNIETNDINDKSLPPPYVD